MDLFDIYGSRSDHDDNNTTTSVDEEHTRPEPGPGEEAASATEDQPPAVEAEPDEDDSHDWPTDEPQPFTGELNEDLLAQPGAFDRLRPYARTGGRTRPDVPLAVESLIVALPVSAERAAQLLPEHARLLRLCTQSISVAEIAAHLQLPVGVTKVIISDALNNSLVQQVSDDTLTDRPSLDLMHRVLEGLQRI